MLHTPSSTLIHEPSPHVSESSQRTRARAELELTQWRARLRFEDLNLAAVYPHGADRSYVRLPSRSGCEVWLICWPAGSRAPLHDHGEASALATMLHGELREWLKPEQDAAVTRIWRGSETVEIPVHARHEVWNESEHTAYSLHVYAPRLASMTFYERAASGEMRALRREDAQQW
jgi:Cysteine dioxygenase type I